MSDRIGERLGPYVLTRLVAEGSMSAVYEAHHRPDGKTVAVKILKDCFADDSVSRARFRREYETVMSLRHQHIVDVFDHGYTEDGIPFLVMELLRGRTLSSILTTEAPLEPARALRLTCQLATALQHAHADGVVHRDLKPPNVFVCETKNGDDARILDFGSVKLQVCLGPKLTAFGTTLGSPHYMSPEQAMGKPDIDPRTDVFALAAIFYEMATGRPAFEGEDVGEIMSNVLALDPAPVRTWNPSYPSKLDLVIRKGLDKNKSLRFGNAIAFAEAALRAVGLRPDVEHWAQAPHAPMKRACSTARFSSPAAGSHPEFHRAAAIRRGLDRRTTIPPK